jgi:hypothetical protein
MLVPYCELINIARGSDLVHHHVHLYHMQVSSDSSFTFNIDFYSRSTVYDPPALRRHPAAPSSKGPKRPSHPSSGYLSPNAIYIPR